MRLLMSKILWFWADCDYERRKQQCAGWTRAQLLAEILHQYEEAGEAMRHLNSRGQIVWKATPKMTARLADAEREARDDAEHDLA
jgi:hypothetical protein